MPFLVMIILGICSLYRKIIVEISSIGQWRFSLMEMIEKKTGLTCAERLIIFDLYFEYTTELNERKVRHINRTLDIIHNFDRRDRIDYFFKSKQNETQNINHWGTEFSILKDISAGILLWLLSVCPHDSLIKILFVLGWILSNKWFIDWSENAWDFHWIFHLIGRSFWRKCHLHLSYIVLEKFSLSPPNDSPSFRSASKTFSFYRAPSAPFN